MKKSKKGAVSDFAADVFSFLAYAIILLVFVFLFTMGRGCQGPVRQTISENIGSESYKFGVRQNLLNYVRTLVDNVENAGNVAELVALTYITDDDTDLKQNVNGFLDEFYPGTCTAICVIYGNLKEGNVEKQYTYKNDACSDPTIVQPTVEEACRTSARLYIPINDNSETVGEITLKVDAGIPKEYRGI